MIYEIHFALNQRPFTIAPNPQFLYADGQYQEALAALEYGVLHRGGFVLLTGEVGTGKTTLCKHVLQNIPANTEVALILHPQLDRLEMLQLVCREFGVDINGAAQECVGGEGYAQASVQSLGVASEFELIERLTKFLLTVYSKGGYSVLIVDEAQHLDGQVLELIRLLTNLETHQDKLLQIILLGQPELQARLQRYDLRQLNQRFTARYHLSPLNFTQLKEYVEHRLSVAGCSHKIFSTSALLMMYKLSGGVPRLINLIADRSLMGGYALNKNKLGSWVVYCAAKEVIPNKKPASKMKVATLTALLIVGIVAALSMLQNKDNGIEGMSMAQVAGDFAVSTYESINNTANTSSDGVKCNLINACWQGRLPIQILPEDAILNVLINNKWVSWQETEKAQLSGLITVQLSEAILYPGLSVKPGETSKAVSWVRNVLQLLSISKGANDLANVDGWQVISPETDKPLDSRFLSSGYFENKYDDILEIQIRQFQRSYGLLVDGVIGQQTLISLALLEMKLARK